MQQYRYSNFSEVFFLNCIFLIDAAVKQLVSRRASLNAVYLQ